MNKPQLPINRPIQPAYVLSLITAVLMTAVSLAGLVFPENLYPSEDLRRSFIPNDLVNLLIGLPILLISLALAQRGKLIGLLFWPGALFYVAYNYLAYAVALPFTWQFIFYLILIGLSAVMIIMLLSRMDGERIREQLTEKVHERLAGGILVVLGGLFFVRAILQLVQADLSGPELGVTIADLLTTPFWVMGGLLLWRKQALGYASGAGLLYQGSMLFLALLIFFILQPILTGASFPLVDFVVIAIMGLVCFIPLGLFVKGIVASPS